MSDRDDGGEAEASKSAWRDEEREVAAASVRADEKRSRVYTHRA